MGSAVLPLYVVHLGPKEIYTAADLHRLEIYLEFFDSTDKEDAANVRVLDGRGRRLRVQIDRLELKSIALESPEVLAEDEEILRVYKRLN